MAKKIENHMKYMSPLLNKARPAPMFRARVIFLRKEPMRSLPLHIWAVNEGIKCCILPFDPS